MIAYLLGYEIFFPLIVLAVSLFSAVEGARKYLRNKRLDRERAANLARRDREREANK